MERRASLASLIFILACLFALGSLIPTALAQTVTGTILGTITDPTGAVIPGVRVVVTNEATRVPNTATTNDAGQYVVPFLPPGKYTIEVEKRGFKKKLVSGIVLEVDQRVSMTLPLEVGEVNQVVEVAGQAPVLNTESSTVGQVIENKKVVDLPLNGRQFMELSFLVPAVHASAPGHFNEILQGFAATGGGGRPTNNNFTIDGVDNVSPNCGYFSVSPSVDSVQEFKIETSNYSAEFGRTSGVVVNVATKSGTNNLHGTLFEFVRNDALGDARNFFGSEVDKLRRNQFGGSVGGPVYLPGIYNGKNRTFFFYDEEHLRERKPLVQTGRVPDSGRRNGDFSQAGFTIYNPFSAHPDTNGVCCIRDPFPGNVIPSGMISDVAKKALAFYPASNRSDPSRNFINTSPRKKDTFQDVIRVDHQISSKDNFFARFAQSISTTLVPGVIPGRFDDNLSFSGVNVAANWIHTFGSRLVNEARAGYNRLNFDRASPKLGTDFAGQLGISGIPATRTSVFPIFGITGFNGLGDTEPYGNIDNIYQLMDMVSYNKGRHGMKFGIDVRRVQSDYFIVRNPSGSYSLSGQYTSAKTGALLPDGFADFLLGLPSSSAITYVGDVGRTRTTNWNAFIQDDWKATPNLTVNLGLRYELYTAPLDKFGRQGFMDPADGTLVYPSNAPLDNPIPGTGITESDLTFPHRKLNRRNFLMGNNHNFGPRVGISYKLPFVSNTVVRAGYGVSYVYFPFSDIGVTTQRLLPFALQLSQTGDLTFPTLANYNFNATGARGVLLAGNPFGIAGLDPNLHWGDTQQFSFDIQHEFAGNWLLDFGYLGNVSHHLAQRYPTNTALSPGTGSLQSRRPFPRYAGVTQVSSDINHDFHAFTARLEKRFSKDYSFLVSYTWSKSIDDGSEVYGTPSQDAGPQDPRHNFRLERGLAPDDVRHRIVISPIWELPFGKGKRFGAAVPRGANWLISGWQINSIMAFQTGFHVTATGGARTNTGNGTRPDQICDPNTGFTWTINQAFNTKCFATPALLDPTGLNPNLTGLTRFGTAPRGSIQTKRLANVDLSVMKNNRIGERLNVQFRWEMFNLPNHPNFAVYYALPVRNFNSSSFGKVFAASDPRLMQGALKLIF